jgi:hypothetical protein
MLSLILLISCLFVPAYIEAHYSFSIVFIVSFVAACVLVMLSVFRLPPFDRHPLILDQARANKLSMRDFTILASTNLKQTIQTRYLQIDVQMMFEDLDLQAVFLKSKGIEPQRKISLFDMANAIKEESEFQY